MAISLPLKTTEADLDMVSEYLKNQVGWVLLEQDPESDPVEARRQSKD